jgi:hypothetical protein
MMAIGQMTVEQFYQTYGNPNIEQEPMQVGKWEAIFHSLNEDGSWKDLTKQKKSSTDISPTAGPCYKIISLAGIKNIQTSVKGIPNKSNFSVEGNEMLGGQ